MALINLCIIPSRPNKDGTFNIKFKISNGSSATYISTRYSVEAKQWNGGQVIRHPQSAMINSKLFTLLNRYQSELDDLDPPKSMTAPEISQRLRSRSSDNSLVSTFAESYIAKLKANKQESYAKNMGYTLFALTDCFGKQMRLKDFSYLSLENFERYLRGRGQSDTTINIRMSHLKALLNAAVNEGLVEYKVFPFRNYRMPTKNVRDICIGKSELAKLRDATFEGVSAKRLTVARDLFLLSFYCAGINLTDLMDATFDKDVLTFIRKKTARRKTGGENRVSMTIQPEAREIINKYVDTGGKLNMGYNYSEYGQFRSFVTKSLNRIGELLGFEKKLMFYSARKTFVQFGSELGVPLYVLEYAIGQTIKEANNRPIFNYLKVMRSQADLAIRMIIDYSFEPDSEDSVPLPEWARRR